MENCDVLIVGGGPAGSTCAWKLKQAGFDVLVLDKSYFPRGKVCGGWITPQVLDRLNIDPGEYGQQRTLQPISAFRTGIIGGDALQTLYDGPVSYGIRRYEFDHFLFERSGARTQAGETVKSIKRSGQGWIVNGHIQTRLLIGAGGHFCPVARLMGEAAKSKQPVVAQETELKMDAAQAARTRVRGEMPELYFCPDMLGYGWCFRKGQYLNIGLGRRDNHGLSSHVAAFASWLKSSGRVPFDLPEPFEGHAYHTYDQQARKRVGDHVMLIGDAAGLARGESGEGILPAVESGILAADAVIACKRKYSRERLAIYEDSLIRRFGNPGAFDPLMLMPSRLKQFLGRRILASPALTRRIVIEGWFLHLSQ